MDDAHFDMLTRGAYVQNFPPAIELIAEGEPSDFLFVVIEGSVELFANWNERETTMATIRPSRHLFWPPRSRMPLPDVGAHA